VPCLALCMCNVSHGCMWRRAGYLPSSASCPSGQAVYYQPLGGERIAKSGSERLLSLCHGCAACGADDNTRVMAQIMRVCLQVLLVVMLYWLS